ncbi:membrane protein [Vallitalea longa]|uniref:Membrane protein n=1 Tax=Vallitalea longa TaxID=2936439 RepID=A0A9W5Y948_9FIRM|nr:ECF transporter S component [Vallitalea longa]GKX28356.1 membrane protein [Vallitalea longa]
MKKKVTTRKLVLASVMVAITVILAYTPLGLIPIPPISPTLLHIPTIIIAIVEGPIMGLIVGIGFGVATLIKAFTMPATPIEPLFMNPLISVLPRALIGITSYYAYQLIKNLLSKMKKSDTIAIGFGAFIGSFTNTIGVLGMIYLLYADFLEDKAGQAAITFVLYVAGTNGLAEAVIATAISIGVVIALKKAYYRK